MSWDDDHSFDIDGVRLHKVGTSPGRLEFVEALSAFLTDHAGQTNIRILP